MVRYSGNRKENKSSTVSNAFSQRKKVTGMFLGDNRESSLNPIQLMPKKNTKKNDDDSDPDYKPPGSGKQKRFAFRSDKPKKTIERTAHKRKNYDKKKYSAVYTCPACRRPLASIKKGAKKMDLTKFSYTSKNNNLKSQRALTLDHFPTWAERLHKLESRNATDQEMKDDYNDESRLRALCKKCNESHEHESTKQIDYESEDDYEGYSTDSGEPENKGFYSPFKYRKDDHDKSGGGSGISV